MKDLSGKKIIVTGGTSGIGEAAVRCYVQLGAQVVNMARSEGLGKQQAKSLNQEFSGRVHFIACDVSDNNQVVNAFLKANQILGGIDALVHNAGVEKSCPAGEISESLWDALMAINGKGTLFTNQAVFPYLKENGGGRIINFGSASGVIGMPGSAAYAASKGAVMAWTRSLAMEWAQYNITVNAIAPAIWTPMYDSYRSSMSPEELREHDLMMAQRVPLGGKLGNAENDLTPMLAFLVSDGAGFITGQTFAIDGGMLMVR